MTDNERIAEWLGATTRDDHETVPADGTLAFTSDCWTPGNHPIVFRHRVHPGFGYAWVDWEPDTNITLWHGPDGLLGEIEKKGLWRKFLGMLHWELYPNEDAREPLPAKTVWLMRRAEPAQLTAALVKMIEEASDVPEE